MLHGSRYAETSIGQGVMPAVRLAIRHVNRSPKILPHHRIRMHWNNTAVSTCTVKKGYRFPVPSQDVTNSARESLVRDGKIDNLFLQYTLFYTEQKRKEHHAFCCYWH
jgi:hypothetical protein